MRAPTNNGITQGQHGQFNAVDYSYQPDSTIYAPDDGTVVFYQNAGDCGNNMQIDSPSGRHGFCHLERALVSVGQQVTKGQPIGIMGYTGRTEPVGPNGRHLHWVLKKGNNYVYPPNFVNEAFGSPQPQGEEIMNQGDVINVYRALLGRDPDPGGLANYTGKPWKAAIYDITGSAEYRERWASKDRVINELQVALNNERNKPPVEVIKEVEKIVEKEVIKEVPVEVPVDRFPTWVPTWLKDILEKIFKKG